MPKQAMSALASFHSRYAPDTEAERYAQAMLADKKPSLIFVVGAGRNFLGRACKRLSPGARIVALQPDALFGEELVDLPDRLWHPGHELALSDFLSASLDDGKAAGGIAVLEWQPVLNAFPREAARLRLALASALEHYATASATRSYWAKRWLRNSVRFALKAKRFARIRRGSGSIIVACAGPSLEYALEAYVATGLPVWALASAQEALERRGVRPSFVLSSDPGFWAIPHLRAALGGDCPLALPPSAALPAALLEGGAPIAALDTGMAFEAMALSAAGADRLFARSSGTAAGTALSLALAACDGMVYMLGQDLAARGLQAHARPYALDRIDYSAPSRLEPVSSRQSSSAYERYGQAEGAWRLSRAFNAYAKDAFLSEAERARCVRVSDSPVDSDLMKVPPGSHVPQAAFSCGPSVEEYASSYSLAERADRMASELKAEATRLGFLLEDRRSTFSDPAAKAYTSWESPGCEHAISGEDSTSLLALAGKAAAPFIAEAARECVALESIESARKGLEHGLGALLELCHA